MDRFKEFFEQVSTVFLNLTKRQKIVVLSSIVAVIAFIVLLILLMRGSGSTQNEFAGYSVLFRNIDPSVSAQVITQLEADGVNYKLADEGTILVPTKDVYKERIAVASITNIQGNNGKVGFELFDNKEFGATEDEQRVKFQRAIQGELSKTIESLEPIERAVVYIAFPKESVFTERQTPPTASVVVKLKTNTSLDLGQIDGIKRIVAGSVANLKVENVKIVTQDGIAIGEDTIALQNEQEAAKIAAQVRYKHEFESRYENKIIDMIASFTGSKEKVTAKVTMEFDFSQTDSEREIFDPNSVIRSEQNIEEHKVGRDKPDIGGVPGAVSNIGPVQGIEDNKPAEQYDKTVSNTNYEISKQIIKTKPQFATIRRITAAVAVDGRYDYERDENGNLLPDELRLKGFGAKLRASSIDELPQLFNVLKGDISFIGPRPLLVEYLPLYSPRQASRHSVRPGITGLAQVNGRNDISWAAKLEHDALYAENLSFLLDIKIALLTIKKVLKKEGVSKAGMATTEKFNGRN